MTLTVPRVEHDEPGFRIGLWRNVVVTVWGSAVSVPRLDRLYAVEIAARAQNPHGLVPFTVITRGPVEMLTVSEAARVRAREIAAEMNPVTIAHPHVVLGGGFEAALARTVISATYVFSLTNYPVRVFDTIAPACAWLAPLLVRHRVPDPPPAQQIELAVEALLRDMVPAPPSAEP